MKKVILIAGGSDGLGKSIARSLSKENSIIILSQSEQKLKKVAGEIGCDFVVADVSDYESVTNAVSLVVKRYKKIDCLINCAGLWIEGELDNNDAEQIRKVIEVNTLGTIFVTKAVIPQMKKHKRGLIIYISSLSGRFSTKEGRSVYAASKFALTGFERSIQLELAKYGIVVTGILPGGMKTDFFEKAGVSKNITDFIDTKEVVELVEFLLSRKRTTVLSEIGIKNINS